MNDTSTDLAEVREVLVQTLGIEDRAGSLTADTELFGSLPELDSMAVVELVAALEDRFGLEVDDTELTGDVFETLGSLTEFVAARRS
ncbi:acyl carrier protein [Geodermatophilus sp. SYSU D01045]